MQCRDLRNPEIKKEKTAPRVALFDPSLIGELAQFLSKETLPKFNQVVSFFGNVR